MTDKAACPVPSGQACANCDGNGGFKVDSMILYGIPGGEDWGEICPVCKGEGTVPVPSARADYPPRERAGWSPWTTHR